MEIVIIYVFPKCDCKDIDCDLVIVMCSALIVQKNVANMLLNTIQLKHT